MKLKKIYYVANARMPGGKAHAIQIAKTCESFIEAGLEVVLILPKRSNEEVGDIQSFYNLRTKIKEVRLPTLNLYRGGTFLYALSSLSFAFASMRYLRAQKKEDAVVYTVDMDSFAGALLRFTGFPYFSEMHGIKRPYLFNQMLFGRISGVISINSFVANDIALTFDVPIVKLLVEPNGVDLSRFGSGISKADARAKLGLKSDAKIVLYNGRVYDWKGTEILVDAASLLPKNVQLYLVGSTKEELMEVSGRKEIPKALICAGSKPFNEMPLWVAAADVLLVLGTARDKGSLYYTSPMKLFEYMPSQRPVIASRTPALTEIVSPEEVTFYEPDNAADLAAKITSILAGGNAQNKAEKLAQKALHHSWQARAGRIIAFIASRA